MTAESTSMPAPDGGDGLVVGTTSLRLDPTSDAAHSAADHARALLTARLDDHDLYEQQMSRALAHVFAASHPTLQECLDGAVEQTSYVLAALSLLADAAVRVAAETRGCSPQQLVAALATELAAHDVTI